MKVLPPHVPDPRVLVDTFHSLHWNGVRISLAALLLILFSAQVACTSSPVWLKVKDFHSQGIWRVCTQSRLGMECIRYTVLPDYYVHIQITMILAICLIVVSVLCFVRMLKKKTCSSLPLTVTSFLTALLIVISLAIFTEKNFQTVLSSRLTFGWSYFIGWVACLLSLVTAGVSILDKRYV